MKRTDLNKIEYPETISASDRHYSRRIINSVRDFINANNLKKVLIAFSGGHDSSCLASICHSVSQINGTSFGLCYVNHNLRSEEEIDKEIDLLGATCAQYNFNFHCPSIEIKSNSNIEAIARELRYKELAKILADPNFYYDAVFTAHHADDDFETIIMRLADNKYMRIEDEKTTQRVVFGMKQISTIYNCKVYRPLLSYSREDLHRYSSIWNLSWLEDSSNKSDKYKRNRIRKYIMPLIKNINRNA